MIEALNQENPEPKNIGTLGRQAQLITFAYDFVVIPIFLVIGPILSNLGQHQILISHIQLF